MALMWQLHHGFGVVLREQGNHLNLRLSLFGSNKLGLGVGDLVLEWDLDRMLGEWGAGGFRDEVPTRVSWHFSGVGGVRLTTGGGMAFSSWMAAVVLIISTAAICPSDIVLDGMIPSCDIDMSMREFLACVSWISILIAGGTAAVLFVPLNPTAATQTAMNNPFFKNEI